MFELPGKWVAIAAILAAALTTAVGDSRAQQPARKAVGINAINAWVPTGSFAKTCKDIRVSGDVVYANCKTGAGSYRATQIAKARTTCQPGSFLNDNGNLRCLRNPAPGGSYRSSCSDIWSDSGTLSGLCKPIGTDKRIRTNLEDYGACRSDVDNMDGYLYCDKGDLPAGDFVRTCHDITYDAASHRLTATCRQRLGRYTHSVVEDTRKCTTGVGNSDGNLVCGIATGGGTPRPTDPGPGAAPQMEIFNCRAGGHPLAIWKLSAGGSWSQLGTVATNYRGNECLPNPGDGLTVTLDVGANVLRALDFEDCGNDPTNGRCIAADISIVGRSGSPTLPYTVF